MKSENRGARTRVAAWGRNALLGLAVCVPLLGSAQAASAATFSPTGDAVGLLTSNAEFAFGSAKIVCPTIGTTGQIDASALSILGLEPLTFLGTCTSSGLGGLAFEGTAGPEPAEPWALQANSLTSVSMLLPIDESGQPMPIRFADGSCELFIRFLPVVTGAWANGTDGSPAAKPSTLTFKKAVSASGGFTTACPAIVREQLEASGLKILWTSVWNVYDTTVPTKAVKLQ